MQIISLTHQILRKIASTKIDVTRTKLVQYFSNACT